MLVLAVGLGARRIFEVLVEAYWMEVETVMSNPASFVNPDPRKFIFTTTVNF